MSYAADIDARPEPRLRRRGQRRAERQNEQSHQSRTRPARRKLRPPVWNTRFSVDTTNLPAGISVTVYSIRSRAWSGLQSAYVLQLRVEAARRHLERSELGMTHVASAVGFKQY
jgi:AraC-like DNA-binding protein